MESGNGPTDVGSELIKMICPSEFRVVSVSRKKVLKGKPSNHRPAILMCKILGKMKDMASNRRCPKIQYQLTKGD